MFSCPYCWGCRLIEAGPRPEWHPSKPSWTATGNFQVTLQRGPQDPNEAIVMSNVLWAWSPLWVLIIYIYYANMMVSYDVIPPSTPWLISGSLPRPAIEDFDGYLPRKCRLLLSSTGMYTKEIINGKARVTGGKQLKTSGAYTKQFGRKVASLFKKNRGKVTWLGLVWYFDSCM